MNAYVEVRSLSHEFSFNSEHTDAFRDISFNLDKGDFLCILGASGCGKTTLLRSLAGFLKPTSGEVLIDGAHVTEPGRHCAMVFQTFDQLLPWKTVLRNVAYPILVNTSGKNAKKEAYEAAQKYLDIVGLEKFKNYYPHQLSGGMKQRVAIARALAMQPSIILMDEPFASVDADTRVALQKELLQIWKSSGATVIFVTHSIIEAISLSTKMLVMGESGHVGVKLFMDNPVDGGPSGIRTPQSPGYSECWTLLSNTIRKDATNGSATQAVMG